MTITNSDWSRIVRIVERFTHIATTLQHSGSVYVQVTKYGFANNPARVRHFFIRHRPDKRHHAGVQYPWEMNRVELLGDKTYTHSFASDGLDGILNLLKSECWFGELP